MKKSNKKLLCILLTLVNTLLMAQSGPIVPCVECEQYTQRTVPVNGLWYNPEQSGVGISIELQRNLLFGTYYGYDSSGQAVWYTFLGELSKVAPETGVMWTFESSLSQFRSGTCINCEYQPPEIEDNSNSIKINFKHKNLASFSINDGEEQSIVPIVFASALTADFSENTSYKIPDLSGLWNFRYQKYEEFTWEGLGYSQLLVIGNKFIKDNEDGTREVKFTISQWLPMEILILGKIICKTTLNEENQAVEPTCTYFSDVTFSLDPEAVRIDFNFPLSGIGDQKLFGESIEGHTFEATRVDLEGYHDE